MKFINDDFQPEESQSIEKNLITPQRQRITKKPIRKSSPVKNRCEEAKRNRKTMKKIRLGCMSLLDSPSVVELVKTGETSQTQPAGY